SRLKTPIEYNSYLAFDPRAEMLISNTQQLMSEERKYATAGNTLATVNAFLTVGTEQIAGAYNFVPVDGTAPIDRLAQAYIWNELLVRIARVPQVAAGLNIIGKIGHTMMLQGERNFDRFRIQVMPPGAGPGPGMVPVGGQPLANRQPSGFGGHPSGT